MQQDANDITKNQTETYKRFIAKYLDDFDRKRVAKDLVHIRDVGTGAATDVVTYFNKTGSGAQISERKTVPPQSSSHAEETLHKMYQIHIGFNLDEKSTKEEPNLHKRNVDICMKEIFKKEDDFVINGDSKINIDGIFDAPSTANTISNNGAWNGSGGAVDIYADFVLADEAIDGDVDASGVLCSPSDAKLLRHGLDSQRDHYWKKIIEFFEGAKKPSDFIFSSKRVTSGNVIYFAKDPEVAELVYSQYPKPELYAKQPGAIYPVEIREWVTLEIHNKDAFVKIPTT